MFLDRRHTTSILIRERMYQELARKAIQAALSNDWNQAVSINLEILSKDPNDVDALNRVSQAHMQLGNLLHAKQHAEKVFLIDPLNSIATKCLERCRALDGKEFKENHENGNGKVSNFQNLFIEEPGKTKIVSLINICEASTCALLYPGETVNLIPKQRRVSVNNSSDHYIGRLPDDLSIRIIHLINEGKEYTSHLKSISTNDVKVFIRDVSPDHFSESLISFPTKRY